jgi:hypothetical protein
MYRKNARNPPYLFTMERGVYGKAGTWQCRTYDGGGTRNILDPSPSKPRENDTPVIENEMIFPGAVTFELFTIFTRRIRN